jgi:hypothetical protein
LDADALGRGNLKCRIVVDETAGHETVISGFTGYGIPCYGDGRTIVCKDYAVSFEAVPKIPQSEAWVYLGKTNAVISDISETVVKGDLSRYSPNDVAAKMFEIEFNRGDSVVAAIPANSKLTAYKDDGFNGRTVFSDGVLGFNGDKTIMIDGLKYKIFGEFMFIDGSLGVFFL